MPANPLNRTKLQSSNLHAFRVVVRGTVGVTRKRKVFTTMARDEGEAALLAQEKINKTCKHFDDVYLAVFPPLPRKAA